MRRRFPASSLACTLACACLLALLACDEDPAGPPTEPTLQNLTGQVTYCGSSGVGVGDVSVRLDADGEVYETTTDAAGAFTFESIPPLPADALWHLERETTPSDRLALNGEDVLRLFQMAEGIFEPSECHSIAGDVNLDQQIDIADAIGVSQWTAFEPLDDLTGQWSFDPIPCESVTPETEICIEFRACIKGDVSLSWPRRTQ